MHDTDYYSQSHSAYMSLRNSVSIAPYVSREHVVRYKSSITILVRAI